MISVWSVAVTLGVLLSVVLGGAVGIVYARSGYRALKPAAVVLLLAGLAAFGGVAASRLAAPSTAIALAVLDLVLISGASVLLVHQARRAWRDGRA